MELSEQKTLAREIIDEQIITLKLAMACVAVAKNTDELLAEVPSYLRADIQEEIGEDHE